MRLSIDDFSTGTLQKLARALTGRAVRVMRSSRAASPLAVSLESPTILLERDRAGLYDYLLGVSLVQRRGDFRAARDTLADSASDRADESLLRTWVEQAHRQWARGAQLADGFYHPRHGHARLPDCRWSEVEWKKLDRSLPQRRQRADAEQWSVVPDVNIEGFEDDFEPLVEDIMCGKYELRQVPELWDEMPVLELPVNYHTLPELPPDAERIEHALQVNRRFQRMFIDCFVRSSENEAPERTDWLHYESGELDASRLVDAYLSMRRRSAGRIFRRTRINRRHAFDPDQHLVVHGVDLNMLTDHWLFGRSRWNVGAELIAADMFRRLGVEFGMTAFADQIISLPNGEHVYLHVPIEIKKPEEPFDDVCWGRICYVLDHPPRFPDAVPACCHTLLVETLSKTFRKSAKRRAHSYRTLMLTAVRPMPSDPPFEFFGQDVFSSMMANALEKRLADLEREYGALRPTYSGNGKMNLAYLYLPSELIDNAENAPRIAKANTLS